MRKLGVLLAVAALAALAYFVWPTPWRYDRIRELPVRIHRITGDAEMLTPSGWQPMRHEAK